MSPASRYREIAIGDLLGPLAGRDVAMLPNNGKLGDALIHAATLQTLARAGMSAGQRLIGGGGNLIDRYEYLRPRLEGLHERFKDVVILPNTIYGALAGAAFAELVPNVRVVCRERHSWLQAAKRGWEFVRIPEVMLDYRVRSDSVLRTCLIPANHRCLVSTLP